MKTILALTAIFLTSCSLTPEQKNTLTVNAIKDMNAAGFAYLTTGSGAAAALAAGQQVILNHTPSAKNPVKVIP